MAQRLTFKTATIKDVVKTFDTMYVVDKLYDYSSYITLYGRSGKLFFEMCVIMGGASTDAMVRLYEPVVGLEDFPPLIINFEELRTITKAIKGDEINFVLDGKNLTINNDKSIHITEASTIAIPKTIVSTLDDFFDNEENVKKLVDFNLVKLYNNMSDIGSNLTMNTLKYDLYGIMNCPKYLVSSDGFSITYQLDGQLPEQFMFPKHSLRILKMLPKIGAKYAVVNHRIFITGAGFMCYIGEWSGFKTYPLQAIDKFVDMEFKEINDANGALTAIRQCHQFDDVVAVYFGLGYVTNKRGTHKELFDATPELGSEPIYVHKTVLGGIEETSSFSVNVDKSIGKLKSGTRIHVFMGMRENEE